MRKKNRKLRRLRELYPDVRIKLFYARDFRALLLKFGRMALVDELTGTTGQATPPRVAVGAIEAAASAADAAADPAIAALLAVREADAELARGARRGAGRPGSAAGGRPGRDPRGRGPRRGRRLGARQRNRLGVGAADAAAGGRQGEPVTPSCAPAAEAR